MSRKIKVTGNLLMLVLKGLVFGLIWFGFGLFRAAPAAYGGSQAKDRIRAVAVGLHHSHSNEGWEPRLSPTPQLMATPEP